MCRFFAIGLWPLVSGLGYTWVMRLDEDSNIWSPVPYDNLFELMATRGLQYGYRLSTMDHEFATQNKLHKFIADYVQENGIRPKPWLLESCVSPHIANFSLLNCGPMQSAYNNFFVRCSQPHMTPIDCADGLLRRAADHKRVVLAAP